MLRDRYDPINIFEMVPALSYTIEPVLARLDGLLDEDTLFDEVRADLAARCPQTLTTGRPSTPVEVILRMLVIKHLHGWSYEQTERWVSDSLVLRQFCRVYLEPVPDDTTVIRWAKLIRPETLHLLLDHVVALARSLKVTRGRKLRVDGTVVETNIHHPTDSTLLRDGVRVLSRTLTRAKQHLQQRTRLGRDAFRDRCRSMKRHVYRITKATRQRGQAAAPTMQAAYRKILAIAAASVAQARAVSAALRRETSPAAAAVAARLDQVRALTEQVIDQTTRRVLEHEQVPAAQKVVSLFEPHTVIIRKGRIGQETEFGRGVWFDEVDGGIISRYAVIAGHPVDTAQVAPSLDHHLTAFGRPPRVLAGDRGTYSASNEAYAAATGVRQVVLPKPGAKSAQRQAHEKQPWFGRGRRWRSGIEGRISVLKRRYKLRRCLNHGDDGMERWVGWGVLAHDLWVIARATAA
jgi:transposase, IS5 family